MNPRLMLLVLLWVSASVFAVLIERDFGREALASGSGGPLEHILGSSKEIIGDVMFLKADDYYHGGVTRKFEETEESEHQEGLIEEKYGEGSEEHGPEHGSSKNDDWIAAVNHRVRSYEHFHLSSETKKEMLPFFALSTALNPHNIDAVLATAFWLEAYFDKVDEAIELLKKANVENPENWQTESRLALIYFNRKKDFTESRKHYVKAILKAQGKKLEYYERVEMYYHLGEICLKQGRKKGAISCYEKALKHLKGRGLALEQTLQKKIKDFS